MLHRIGATKGRYARDEDKPIVIGTGMALITERRVVFAGAKQTREWLWSKLVTLTHDNNAPSTGTAVEDRQTVSLISYSDDRAATDVGVSTWPAPSPTERSKRSPPSSKAERAEHARQRPGNPLPLV